MTSVHLDKGREFPKFYATKVASHGNESKHGLQFLYKISGSYKCLHRTKGEPCIGEMVVEIKFNFDFLTMSSTLMCIRDEYVEYDFIQKVMFLGELCHEFRRELRGKIWKLWVSIFLSLYGCMLNVWKNL